MSDCERCEEFRRALANQETVKSPTLRGMLQKLRDEHETEHRIKQHQATNRLVSAGQPFRELETPHQE